MSPRRNARALVPRPKDGESVPIEDVQRMIEEAVGGQLRTALCACETREQLRVAEADWQSFGDDHFGLVRALVKEVSYDGATGAVSLNLMRSEASHED